MSSRVGHRAASALLLVLWALIMLSAAVFAFAKWVQQDIQLHGEANRDLEARAMAHSGLALALHPQVTQKTPGLEETFPGGLGYRVKIISEGGKLNIRWLLEGEEPRKLTILKQWLEQRGLTFDERERFVDCLLDWVDADDVKRLNGAEQDGDYQPANRMLQSLDEITQVRGSEPLIHTEGWRDALTLDSAGQIDISAADANVLRLLPGLSEANINRFIQYRRGQDGIDGTADDIEFKSLKDAQSFLGLSAPQFKELGGLITNKDPTLRIISEGYSGNVVRQVEVVVRKSGGGTPQILSWKE